MRTSITASGAERARLVIIWSLGLSAMLAGAGCRCADSGVAPVVDRGDGKLPELVVPKVSAKAMKIDGRLDEVAWKTAGESGAFVDVGNGKPRQSSKVAAWAKALWSSEALYIAVRVADGDPQSPFQRDAVDPHIWARASGIEVMLQPGDPGHNKHYYEVQVDIAGAVWDTRFDDYNRPISGRGATRRYGHQSWSAKLQRAVHIDRAAGAYVIELALPFETLKSPYAKTPPKAGDRWRANFYSFRDGQRHALGWSPILRKGNFHKASRFGVLRFGG